MSDHPVTPAQRRTSVQFTKEDIDDILPDLPGGQSVSPAMRRLHVELRAARDRLTQADNDEEQPDVGELLRPALQLVQVPPEPSPRRYRIEHRLVRIDPEKEKV